MVFFSSDCTSDFIFIQTYFLLIGNDSPKHLLSLVEPQLGKPGCRNSPLVGAPLAANAEVLVNRVPHVTIQAEAFSCKHTGSQSQSVVSSLSSSPFFILPQLTLAIPMMVLFRQLENILLCCS